MAQATTVTRVTLTVVTVRAVASRALTLGPMVVSRGFSRGVTFQSQPTPSIVHLPLLDSSTVTLALLLLKRCSMVTLLLLCLV